MSERLLQEISKPHLDAHDARTRAFPWKALNRSTSALERMVLDLVLLRWKNDRGLSDKVEDSPGEQLLLSDMATCAQWSLRLQLYSRVSVRVVWCRSFQAKTFNVGER